MKKIFKALCSVFFATSMAFPASTLANPLEDFDDTPDEVVRPVVSDDYTLAFLTGDFGLHFSRTRLADPVGTLMMFLSNPDGRIVKDAQVVVTIIDRNGDQQMHRARPVKGGYLVDTAHLSPGQYRLESEIVTDGWLLTDETRFTRA